LPRGDRGRRNRERPSARTRPVACGPSSMRKQIVSQASEPADASSTAWMDLESHGRVRLTSEDATWPIESALQDGSRHGWKADSPRRQTIWISFDVPQAIRQIHLRFEIAEHRTQEFVLLASSDGGLSYREIVRQQFNFSPATTSEDEHYFPHLNGITDLK